MMPILFPLVEMDVAVITNSGTSGDDEIYIMARLDFQCVCSIAEAVLLWLCFFALALRQS